MTTTCPIGKPSPAPPVPAALVTELGRSPAAPRVPVSTLVESAFGSQRIDDMRTLWPAVIRSSHFLTTAVGRLVLAYRPELVDDLRSQALRRLTPYTVTNWGQVDNAVEIVRDNGVAIEHEQTTLGYSCVAAGVHDQYGKLVGAIGVAVAPAASSPSACAGRSGARPTN